jgi:hypothetical protein
VDELSAGGVAVVSLGGVVVSPGGVAVESLGGGADCSAGGSELGEDSVPADCCFEQAETSRSAPTLRNKAMRFIGSPHCLGCASRGHGGITGRTVLTRMPVKRSDVAIGVTHIAKTRSGRQQKRLLLCAPHAELEATS